MPGIFGLSVNKKGRKNFAQDLLLGVFYQQHFNEDWGGFAVFNKEKQEFNIDAQAGLFRTAFRKKINTFQGTEGIGSCGIAEEPIEMDTKVGKMCLCFSGNIRNCLELKEKLKKKKVSFSNREGDDLDIEVIANLIAQGKNIINGIKLMTREIEGAYSLLILTKREIFAVSSPDGHWPLTLGKGEGKIAVASSSAGFSNLGLKVKMSLRPGRIISMQDGSFKQRAVMPKAKTQTCSFFPVYTDFPSGIFQKTPISLIRKRLGAALARQDIDNAFIPDIVAPIPDSGRFHAIGYHSEFCHQVNKGKIKKVPLYDEVLLKYPYAGRSFTPRSDLERKEQARIKILPSSESYQDKVIVVLDDSIVRGTQIRTNLVPKLRSLGAKEIHLRIANPELRSHCPWGKTTKEGEILAASVPSIQERAKILGVDSLAYNSIEALVQAIGIPRKNLCLDCDFPSKNTF